MSHPWDSISGPLFASYILSVPSSVMFSDLAIFFLLGSLSHYYWVVKNNIIHIYIWSTNHLPRVSQILCLVCCLSFNYQSLLDILYGVCWIFTATTGFFLCQQDSFISIQPGVLELSTVCGGMQLIRKVRV